MVAVREPGQVPDLDEQPRRTRRADTVQAQQRGAGRRDELLQLLVGGLLPGIDPLEVSDQLRGHALAGLADRVPRSDAGQQGLGLGGREVLLRATGQHFQQDPVQLADLAGVLVPDRAAPVDEQLQHLELRVGHNWPQPGHAGADQSDRVRVGGVGLALLLGRERLACADSFAGTTTLSCPSAISQWGSAPGGCSPKTLGMPREAAKEGSPLGTLRGLLDPGGGVSGRSRRSASPARWRSCPRPSAR